MKLPLVTVSGRGFALALALWIAPAWPIALLLEMLTSVEHPQVTIDAGTYVFLGLVVVPLYETVLLVVPTALALRAVRTRWLACLLGCLPIVLWHGVDNWQKPIIVAASFALGAYWYASLGEQGESRATRFGFLVAVHAAANLMSFSIRYAFWGSL